jgi:hypothetical protein
VGALVVAVIGLLTLDRLGTTPFGQDVARTTQPDSVPNSNATASSSGNPSTDQTSAGNQPQTSGSTNTGSGGTGSGGTGSGGTGSGGTGSGGTGSGGTGGGGTGGGGTGGGGTGGGGTGGGGTGGGGTGGDGGGGVGTGTATPELPSGILVAVGLLPLMATALWLRRRGYKLSRS